MTTRSTGPDDCAWEEPKKVADVQQPRSVGADGLEPDRNADGPWLASMDDGWMDRLPQAGR